MSQFFNYVYTIFVNLKKVYQWPEGFCPIFILNSGELQENFQEQYNKCMYLFHTDSGTTSCHICEHSLHIHKYNFLSFFPPEPSENQLQTSGYFTSKYVSICLLRSRTFSLTFSRYNHCSRQGDTGEHRGQNSMLWHTLFCLKVTSLFLHNEHPSRKLC